MSSSLALFFLPSVKKHKQVFLFCSMYNKTIIRFGFCDIQNNQGRRMKANNPTSTLIIRDITKASSDNCLKFLSSLVQVPFV